MGLLKDLTTSLKPVSNTVADTFGSGELIDTGEITQQTGLPLNGVDNAEAQPVGADLDVLSFRSADGNTGGFLEIGLLPEASNGWSLSDLDVLSGSYGASHLLSADLGPDISSEPVIGASILGHEDQPFRLEILGVPVLDPLNEIGGDAGGMDSLVPLAIANDLLSGGLGGGLLSGGLGGGLLSGGLTDGLLSGGIIPAGLGDVLPTDVIPLGLLDGLLGDGLI